jgi:hypothetical protein
MAKQAGIDPKSFRKALRDERLSWHNRNDRWTVDVGSEQHAWESCKIEGFVLPACIAAAAR